MTLLDSDSLTKGLNVNDLATRCREESAKSPQHRDPRYCFELFRRAIVWGDTVAWEVVATLVEVLYLPAASLLGRWSGPRPRRALIVGHDHDGRLPAALREAQAIYEVLATAAGKTGMEPHLLLSEDATDACLRQHAPDCGLLHLATHGVFRQDNPLFSALRLADHWLTLADVERLALPQAALVTLSACETGLGDLRRGDIFGLSQAFMQAGAASLVVSLWPVPDESTRQLMIHFYQYLVAGRTKAAALRSAQLTLRSNPAYGHPLHWAGFVLIGDGGVL
jgi:hypothetical protein